MQGEADLIVQQQVVAVVRGVALGVHFKALISDRHESSGRIFNAPDNSRLVAVQVGLQRQIPGRDGAETGFQVFQQQAAARTGLLLQAQRVDAGAFRFWQTVFAEQRQQFAA